MRLIPARLAEPGMRLGRSITDPDGRLILAAGVTLRQRYIDLVIEQGYTSLYVTDELDQVELPELVTLETRREVMSCIREFTREGAMGKLATLGQSTPVLSVDHAPPGEARPRPDLAERLARAARVLTNEVLSRPNVVIGLVDIKSLRDYSFAHAVQVALIAIACGRSLGLSENELVELGTGALLHDVGKVVLDESLWNKNGRLDTDEYEIAKMHTFAGFDFLRKADISLLAAHVALQHHERWDGSGYPRGLRGCEAIKYARLCAVCDVFDAITSDRPYKAAAHPAEALAFISDNSGRLFDPCMVEALRSVVAPYPVATGVLLSTGETAIVKQINCHALDRPVVSVAGNRRDRTKGTAREIDLSKTDDITIVGYLALNEDRVKPARGRRE